MGESPLAPALRLLCLPMAGAGASAYRRWRLPGELSAEVWAARLPGREARRDEPPAGDLDAVVEELAEAAEPLLDLPYAVFGHSMGALLGYELVRLLRAKGRRQPVHVFLSGQRAPHRLSTRAPVSAAPDEVLLARLLEMAGTSRTAIRDPAMLMYGAPATRADLAMCERYRHRAGSPLTVPISCFAAVDDSEFAPADVAAWCEYSTQPGRLVLYDSGHLFVLDHRDAICAELAWTLTAAPSRVSRARRP